MVSLGATWILDGLEVTLAGALGGVLTRHETLGLSDAQVGASATCYLAGAVIGALLFGYGTDRFGRKKLFFITVAVYLVGTALSGFSWNFWSYALFRAITGAGIGGEYAAINSAIDELIPARVRGRVDLIINGSYWVGAAMGAAATLVLLDPRYLPIWLGWRCAFGIGATLGLIVIFFRRWIPESPRWLMIHGRNRQAEEIVADVQRKIYGARDSAANERLVRGGVMHLFRRTSFQHSITPSLQFGYALERIRPGARSGTRLCTNIGDVHFLVSCSWQHRHFSITQSFSPMRLC